MKLSKVKRKVLISWIISYLFILFCSLITGIMIYSSAIRVINIEVQNVSRVSLENIKTLLDGKLRELGTAASIMEMDSNIRNTVQTEFPFASADTILGFRRCKDLFTRTMAYNTYISDIYLYAPESGIMLSSRFGLNEDKKAMFPAEKAFGISRENFFDLLTHRPSDNYIILPPVEGSDFEQILFFYPILNHTRENDGVIIIQINTEKLLGLIRGTEGVENTGLVIMDENDQQIITLERDFDTRLFSYAQMNSLPFEYMHNGRSLMIYSAQSSINLWKYVFIYNMDKYLSSIHRVRNMTVLFLILMSVFGIMISFLLAKRNYSPIERLILKINRFMPDYGLVGTNELQILEKSFNTLYQEKVSFSQRLTRQKDVILSSIFVQLLKGKISSLIKVEEVMSVEAVTFKSDKFIVVAMSVENFGIFLENSEEDPDINRAAEITYVVVKNILEEMLGDKQKGYVVEIDTMLACIINVTGDGEQALGFIIETIGKALEVIMLEFKILIYASVSNIHTSIFYLSKCYLEAQEALEKSILFGAGSAVTQYSDIVKHDSRAQVGYLRLEKRYAFLSSLLAENFENAERLAIQFIEVNLKDISTKKEFNIRKYSLIDDLFSALEMISTDSDKVSWQEANSIILELANSKNISEYRLLIQKLFSLFRQIYIEKEDFSNDKDKIKEIVQFIDNNLKDPNLSVTMISDNFGLCLSHVTRLLRSKMGVGTLEYIQKKRIETAKKLLCETDKSANDIAMQVGYYNFRTLNYAFKRLEGITASQYRELSRKTNKIADDVKDSK